MMSSGDESYKISAKTKVRKPCSYYGEERQIRVSATVHNVVGPLHSIQSNIQQLQNSESKQGDWDNQFTASWFEPDESVKRHSVFQNIQEAFSNLSQASERVLLVCLRDIAKMKHNKAAVNSDDVSTKSVGMASLKTSSGTRSPRKLSPSNIERDNLKGTDNQVENSKSDTTASGKKKGRKTAKEKASENKDEMLKPQGQNTDLPCIVITDTNKNTKSVPKRSPVRKGKQAKDTVNSELNQPPVDVKARSPVRKRKESASPAAKSRTPSSSPNRGRRKTTSVPSTTKTVTPKSSPKRSPRKPKVQVSPVRSASSSSVSSSASSPQTSASSSISVPTSPCDSSAVSSPVKKTKQNSCSKRKSEKVSQTIADKPSSVKPGKDIEKVTSDKSQGSPVKKTRQTRKSKDTPIQEDGNSSLTDSKDSSTVRALDFGDDVTMIESLKMSVPTDFQYKYTNMSEKDAPLGLSDLITKVDSSIKGVNPDLIDLFGCAPDPEDDESSESTIVGDKSDESFETANTVESSDSKDESKVAKDGKSEKSDEVIESEDADVESKISKEEGAKAGDISEASGDTLESGIEENQNCAEKFSNIKAQTCEEDISGGKVKSSGNKTEENKENNCQQSMVVDKSVNTKENMPKSIFEMFGLQLKRKSNANEIALSNVEDIEKANEAVEKLDDENLELTDADIPKLTEPEVIEIPSNDEEDCQVEAPKCLPEKPVPGSRRRKNKVKRVIAEIKTLEPTSLDILSKFEKIVLDKKSAFFSKGLDKYIEINKACDKIENDQSDSEGNDDLAVEKFVPDFDEVDGVLFLSFPNETALKGHIQLESKYDWVKENTLKKIGQVQTMKIRQQIAGCSRLTDAKIGDEQKHSFRGIPMKLMKYKKHLKSEVEALLDVKPKLINDFLLSKSSSKTTDITKIKGWKNKFQNSDELQDSAGVRLPESGKLHWKTEERLLKSLDPDDVKDIGLDLKKKRRKLVNYSNKKKQVPKLDSKSEHEQDFEYSDDNDCYITEKDVYNEDEYKDYEGKLPYSVRYTSQFKYGARKMFVKRMKLDAEDERILKKLGTQKMASIDGHKDVVKESKQFSLSKLNTAMALAAVTALDKKLIAKAKSMAKAAAARNKTNNQLKTRACQQRDEPDGEEDAGIEEEEENEELEYMQDESDYRDDDDDEESESEMVLDESHENQGQDLKGQTYKTRSRANSRSGREQGKPCDKGDEPETSTTLAPSDSGSRVCDQPGCRYGCICHLCKLSDSGEEKEADIKPPCDKEYCKLGCICDSVDTSQKVTKTHCKKPGCMLECKCPPKQQKPDIPREDGQRKKKKGKGKKKKSPSTMDEVAEAELVSGDEQEDWEPPSKKKRTNSNARFANLPRRETTYRVAKNLDAVSRKAMEVYATSEMYTEQHKIRRRKSDNWSDPQLDEALFQSLSDESQPREKKSAEKHPRPSGWREQLKHARETTPAASKEKAPVEEKVLEISDESEDEVVSSGESSCARTRLFTSNYNRSKPKVQISKPVNPENVIDLVESDTEECNRRKGGGKSRAHNIPTQPQVTASDKLGLNKRIVGIEEDASKWKTQMVCLKAKKRPDNASAPENNEPGIRLLEIISNCPWEDDRTLMLSKISQIIAREVPVNHIEMWGKYVLQFLPQADKPAVIPPELQLKLPQNMFSIRIRVTQSINDIERAQNSAEEKGEDATDNSDKDLAAKKLEEMTEAERKKYTQIQQKKLIDKIKFAEKLRDLIIAEEKKGTQTSKFSVSRDGIDRALKRYKTQLWKAYTGTNNFSLMQLKKAVQAAKKTGSSGDELNPSPIQNTVNFATLARIQSNQGLQVVCPNASIGSNPQTSHMQSNQFISLSNIQACSSIGTLANHSSVKNVSSTQPVGYVHMSGTSSTITSQGTTIVSSMQPFSVLQPSNTISSVATPGQTFISSTQSVNTSSSLNSTTSTTSARSSDPPQSKDASGSKKLDVKLELVVTGAGTVSNPNSVKITGISIDSKIKADTTSTSSCNLAQSEATAQPNLQISNVSMNSADMAPQLKPYPISCSMVVRPHIRPAAPLVTTAVTGSSSVVNTSITTMPTLTFSPNLSKPLVSSVASSLSMSLGSSSPLPSGTVITPANPLPHLAGSEVLLIPVPDKGQGQWDIKTNPVLSAKVSVLPPSGGINSAYTLSKAPVPSGLRMVGTGRSPVPGSSSVMPAPLTVFTARGQSLNGKQLVLQPNKPGSSHLMINTIEPVTSMSPLYSHVKGMRFPMAPAAPLTGGVQGMAMNGVAATSMPNTTCFPPKVVALSQPIKQVLVYPTKSASGNSIQYVPVSASQTLDDDQNIMSQDNVNNSLLSPAAVSESAKKRKRTSPAKANEDKGTKVLKDNTDNKNDQEGTGRKDKKKKSSAVEKPRNYVDLVKSKDSAQDNEVKPEDKLKAEDSVEGNCANIDSELVSDLIIDCEKTVESNDVSKDGERETKQSKNYEDSASDAGIVDAHNVETLLTNPDKADEEADKENQKDNVNNVLTCPADIADQEDCIEINMNNDEIKQGDSEKPYTEMVESEHEIDKTEICDDGKPCTDEHQKEDIGNETDKDKDSTKDVCADTAAVTATDEEIQLHMEVENILNYDSDSNCGTDSIGGSVKSFGSFGEVIDLTDVTEVQSAKVLTTVSPIPGCSEASGVMVIDEIVGNTEDKAAEVTDTTDVNPDKKVDIPGSSGVVNKRKSDTDDASLTGKRLKTGTLKVDTAAIVLEESEESDVDILSVDMMLGPPPSKHKPGNKLTLSPTQAEILQEQRRTERLGKRIRQKLQTEKNRRMELRIRLKQLEQIVYKYSPGKLQERSKATVLTDALKLLAALEEKSSGLQECVLDGQQYQEQLKEELDRQKACFVGKGLPAEVVNNFLKSVASASAINVTKKRRQEACEQEDEDPFSELQLGIPVVLDDTSMPQAESIETSKLEPVVYVENDEDNLEGMVEPAILQRQMPHL